MKYLPYYKARSAKRAPKGGPWGCCWRSCSSHVPVIQRNTALGSNCSRMANAWRRGRPFWQRGWPLRPGAR
eukprot:9369936-Lingulodinium_polyedra.AAC.1